MIFNSLSFFLYILIEYGTAQEGPSLYE